MPCSVKCSVHSFAYEKAIKQWELKEVILFSSSSMVGVMSPMADREREIPNKRRATKYFG